MQKSDRIKKILTLLKETYPESKISLNFESIFQLLVSTILSAQSTDKSVNKVTPSLFSHYPDAETMSKATPDDIKPFIKSIGLYNNKSKNLVKMATKVVNDYDGKVPATMKELLTLPGVGRKTANVVLGNGFGVKDSGITVDTHVTRLANRMGFTKSKNPLKIEKDLMKITPVDDWVIFTHLFIAHGRKICGRKPKCDQCTVSEFCNSAFKFDHFKD